MPDAGNAMNAAFRPDQIAAEEIRPEEMLLWTGRPLRRRVVLVGMALLTLGAPITLLALLWILITLLAFHFGSAGWLISLTIGLLILLPGVVMAAGSFFLRRHMSQMVYALTDERALFIRVGRRRRVHAYPLSDLTELAAGLFEDGVGSGRLTAAFWGRALRRALIGRNALRRLRLAWHIGFVEIPEARRALSLLRNLIGS
jgi:hypothetical protein